MNINYNPLRHGRDARLKKDVGENFSSPPKTELTTTRTWLLNFLLLVAVLIGFSANAQCIIGTGTTNTNSSTIDPIERYYNYEHFQMVYTAAELSAGGMSAGSTITALGFSVSESAASLANFTISMGLTSQTTASPYISSGLTVVKPAFTYVPVVQAAGSFQMITLTTPFIWNGTSSIVVNTCTGSNPFTSPYGGLRYTATAGNTVNYTRTDGSSNCATANASFATTRPNIRFDFTAGSACSGTPAPGNTIASASTTCSGSSVNLSLQNLTSGSGVTYQWQSSSTLGGTYTDISGATSSVYSPTITATTYFRANVTCSGSTGTSNPVGVSLNPFYSCYPAVYASSTADEEITNVTVGTLNNSSICGTTAPGAGSVQYEYSNYRTSVAAPSLGQSSPVGFSLTQTTCGGTYGNGFQIFIDYNQNGVFTDAGEMVYNQTTATTGNHTETGTFTVPATALLGTTGMRVVVVETTFPTSTNYSNTAYSWGETEDYLVTITAPPACIAPTGIVTSTVTNSGASFSWTASSSNPANGYEYEIRTSGAGGSGATGLVTSGTTASGVTTASVSGLSADTSYNIYVRSACDATTFSTWSGPTSFYTGYCQSTVTTPSTLYFTNFTTTGGYININNTTTSSANGYNNFTAQAVGKDAGQSVSFSATMNATYFYYGMSIFVDWNNDMDFADAGETVWSALTYSSATTQSGTFTIPVGTPLGNYRMRVRMDGTNYSVLIPACGSVAAGETEDYTFSVINPPTCLAPTGLTSTPSSLSATTISWTASTSAPSSGYEYEVRTSGAVGSGSTGLVASGTTAAGVVTQAITGLTLGTTYNFYVRGNCGAGDFSSWATSSFVMGYCIPTTTNGCGSGDHITSVTFANINNATGTCISGGSYSNYQSSTAAVLKRTVSYPVSIAVNDGGTEYAGAWVDWNQNGTFDATEYITLTDADGISPWIYNGTATVPADAVLGTTGLRIRSSYSAIIASNSACSTYSYGETEDYLANIQVAPINVTSFSPTSACSSQLGSTVVTLTGTTFTGATSVTLNGSSVPFTVVNDTTITVNLSSGLTGGPFAVSNATTTGTSSTNFAVIASPVVAPIGNGNSSVCVGGTITLTESSPGGTYSSSNDAIATADGANITGVSAGTVTISYTVTDLGCTTTVTTTVTVNAPIVSSNPTVQTVVTGTNATYSVTASGTITGYQWMVSTNGGANYTNISNDGTYSGVNTNTLTINNTPADLNGYYYAVNVIGTSPCASFMSNGAILNVGDTGITSDPASVTLCSTGTGTASFSVVASGTVDSYTWYVDYGAGPEAITDGTAGNVTYSGATTATLNVSGIDLSNNGWIYYVDVAGPANTATSAEATLTVNQGGAITTNPINKTLCYSGGSTSFSVAATGSITGYQWQYSTNGTSWNNVVNGTPVGATYTGGTSTTLGVTTTGATPAAGTYYYRAIANLSAPCSAVISTTAQLLLNTPTVNVVSSSSVICNPGGSAVTLTASGTATSYSWSPSTGLSSTTGAVVSASPTTTTTYTVTGTEASGCSKTATVTVNVGSSFTVTATSTPGTVCPGANAQLQAVTPVNSTSVTGYNFAATTGTFTPLAGGTVSTALADDGTQTAVPIGFSFTYNGTVYTSFGISTNGNIQMGSAAPNNAWTNSLAGTANVIAPFWDDNYNSGTISYLTTGVAPNRVLTVSWANVSIGGAGSSANAVNNYQVKLYEGTNAIKFSYGTLSAANGITGSIGLSGTVGQYLSVTPGAPATTSTTVENSGISSVANLASGTEYTFTPTIPTTYTYSWSPSTYIAGQTTLANPVATAVASNITYTVVVTNAAGCTATATTSVNVQSGASITTQPVAVSNCQGANATFTVVAAGSGLTYQWRKDGVAITGNASATTATLSLTATTPANNGNYDVVVTPTCGPTATSNAVALLVYPTPTATAPTAQSYCAGVTAPATILAGTPSGVTFDITGGAAIGLANQTAVTSVPSFTAIAGTATITITPKANGCTGTAVTYTITVNALPTTVSVTPSSSAMCSNGAAVLLTASGGSTASAYCTPTVSSAGATGDYLDSFTFANLTNNASGDAANDYTYYSNLTANVVANGTTAYSLSFASGPSWTQGFGVWIDYNHNGTFETTEFVYASTAAALTATGSITIPTTALNGVTRMRVAARYASVVPSTESCTLGSFGEFEDYNVNITGGVNPGLVWSPTAGLYTNAAATVPYTGAAAVSVYAKPAATATYTATATGPGGCTASAQATVTVTNAQNYYADADGDGYGNAAVTYLGCAQAGYVLNNTDCNDSNASQYQSATLYIDADNDGYTNGSAVVCYGPTIPAGYVVAANGSDCNDNNAAVHATFSFYVDADHDSYGTGSLVSVCAVNASTPPTGYSLNNTDCDDNNAAVYQSATLYVDADNDGYTTGVSAVVCYGATVPSGYAATNIGIDCNDAVAAINPGHVEVLYNGVDDNCNGVLDEGFQITSQVQAAQCGTTLTSISSLINAVSLPQITYYRFEVTNTETNAVQVIDKPLQFFALTELTSYTYGTTYSIRVQVQRNGIWLGYYGSACQVSSPAVTSTSSGSTLPGTQCGSTLTSINQLISTTSLAGATAYRFRITNVTDLTAPNQVQILDRPLQWFNLPMLSTYNYGTSYMIEVSVKTNGVYSGYGAPCTVTAPPVPSLAQCGGAIATSGTQIYTTSLAKVTSYRFEVTNLLTNQVVTVDKALHWFSFNNIPGYVPSAQYGVRVAVMTSGVYSQFGDACEITSPGAARAIEVASPAKPVTFTATAYPNPFADNFRINVSTSSEASIGVKVYDMTGRLLETREVEVSQMQTLEVGDRYPSGVYNVIVSQGDAVKTLRVVKR